MAKTEPTLQDISDQLGEAIHTAFRKGSGHPQASVAWKAIDALPPEEWGNVLDFIRSGMGLPLDEEQ